MATTAINSPKPAKRKRKLSQLKRNFAEELAAGKNIPEASKAAGYSESVMKSTAYVIANELEADGVIEDIRERNRQVFNKLGFTTDKRFCKILELTEAKKTISAVSGNAADGKTVDFIEVPDNTVQLAATKEALKLAGDYPEDRLQLDTGPGFEALLNSAREAKGRQVIRERTLIVDADAVDAG